MAGKILAVAIYAGLAAFRRQGWKLVRVMTFVFCQCFCCPWWDHGCGDRWSKMSPSGRGWKCRRLPAVSSVAYCSEAVKGNVINRCFWCFYLAGDRQPFESARFYPSHIRTQARGLIIIGVVAYAAVQHDEKAVNDQRITRCICVKVFCQVRIN